MLRVFENRVLRRIFGPKRDVVRSESIKVQSEKLNALYASPSIFRVIKSRIMSWAGYVARMGASRGVYRVLVGKPEVKRPLGRPRLGWEGNIKMDRQELLRGSMEWIELVEDRNRWRALVNTV
jgi:hypothetical protein